MFQMLGVFAAFERSMIRERVMAGLSRAPKADGIQLGRRRLEDRDADKVAAIVAARAEGTGISRIAREPGVGVGTVLRVSGEVWCVDDHALLEPFDAVLSTVKRWRSLDR
jgi:DNA invertase Pin-like site-specific DNA recombinase